MKCVVCKKNKKLHCASTCTDMFCKLFLVYGYYENGKMKLTKKGIIRLNK